MGAYEFTRATLYNSLQRGGGFVHDGTYALIPGWIGNYRTWTADPITETSGYEIAFRPVFHGDKDPARFQSWDDIANYYPDARIGVWTDDDGVTYLDYTIHVACRQHAVELGIQFNQLAIWDWADNCTITTGETTNGIEGI